ncbi:MAG TPA: Zn(2+)-responsive transcriptional regulator [Spongiibacteraceae bacterium]|nr:Zn(2+)-responsive transcriptional regulator [Spongiibacteraceae bacterium]HCS26784.1 Zn(2+)-responsive transcriptional regulator [Spongiibacteraceae bacterium]
MAYPIGKFSKLTGCNIETLRFYEREGLLPPPPRGDNGYRYYNDEAVSRVKFILHAKQLGFSLKDISELLSIRVDKNARTCADVKQIAVDKLTIIRQRIDELEAMHQALSRVADACDGAEHSAHYCTILQSLEADGFGKD